MMRITPIVSFLALMTTQTACVTVNVNFHESAVQKATDDYVRDLYRAKEKGRTPNPAPTTEAPKKGAFDHWLVNEAWAADATGGFSVNSDRALKIKDRLAANIDEVIAQKRAGVLG